jgi:TetR/AcrR family transcriptional regulator
MSENEYLTEDRIFEAATLVFEEKGMAAARMQDIANKAGINKSMLHYYFRTKEHLFDTVFLKLAQKMFMKFTPIFEEDMSLEEKIRFFIREHIKFLQENPRLPGFILNEINHNPGRIKRLIKNINFKRFWIDINKIHKDELERYNISEKNLPQIMTTIASLSVFPFAAKGILEVIFENFNVDFDDYIEERKEFAAEFVIKAITK